MYLQLNLQGESGFVGEYVCMSMRAYLHKYGCMWGLI